MKSISRKEFNELNKSIAIISDICHEEGDFLIGEDSEFTEEVKKLRDTVLEFERNTGFKLNVRMDGVLKMNDEIIVEIPLLKEIEILLSGMQFFRVSGNLISSRDEAITAVAEIIEALKENDLDSADAMLDEFRRLERKNIITLEDFDSILDFAETKARQ